MSIVDEDALVRTRLDLAESRGYCNEFAAALQRLLNCPIGSPELLDARAQAVAILEVWQTDNMRQLSLLQPETPTNEQGARQ